jgi:hypothetical protein
MNRLLSILTVTLALTAGGSAQIANSGTTNPSTSSSNSQAEQRGNANVAGADAKSGENPATKEQAAKKTSTVIGCLTGPDFDGHFELRNMQYRSGVDVVGPDELASTTGSKIKLIGQWVPIAGVQTDKGEKKIRRFEVSSFEVMAEKCSPPAETTPISKKKQQQQKAAAKENAGDNPK